MSKEITIRKFAEIISEMDYNKAISFKRADDDNIYGVKLITIFDEPMGFLTIGCWGSENTTIWSLDDHIELDDVDDIAHCIASYLETKSTEDIIYIEE